MCSKPLLLVLASCALAQEIPAFGTTVAISSGLEGKLYLLKQGTEDLPNFNRLRPIGTIYTTSLQIPPRAFQGGFPAITDRYEWFAVDYTGRFWVEQPGVYRFRLLSDDGSKLYINDKLLIDNDGTHAPQEVIGSAHFSRGVHRIRVSYFQGPRYQVALVLSVARPDGDAWQIFDTNDYKPPSDPREWVSGTLRNVRHGSNR